MLQNRHRYRGAPFALAALTTAAFSAVAGPPPLELELTYSDRFPTNDIGLVSLLNGVIEPKSWLDTTHADGDESTADMGDSATVIAGTAPGTRAFLNFRVYPGPATDTGDPFFSRFGGGFIADGIAPDPFAKARMDSAESATGVSAGTYATYLHETEGGVEGSDTYKLIPDGILAPGATVEYFFSADTGPGTAESIVPDTTGGRFLEWEALPGFFATAFDIRHNCVLFVDAAPEGQRGAIEEFGLAPYLGTITDSDGLVHQGWDRYDYTNAAADLVAPLGRVTGGDNGITRQHSLVYETILYHTGTHPLEGLRNADANLLIDWLTTDDYGRDMVTKGLWLNGHGMARILSTPGRLDSNLLIEGFARASLVCEPYRDPGCGGPTGDDSYCVRLDPVPGAHFGTPVTYAAAVGNGEPALESFAVIEAIDDGKDNLSYVDQDAGEAVTLAASVSSDELDALNPFGVVIDGFSLDRLRRVPDGFTGSTEEDCGTLDDGMGGTIPDSTAITTRIEDVFAWFGLPTGQNTCSLPEVFDVADSPGPTPINRLMVNAPNPLNPRTRIRYEVAAPTHVVLAVYDVRGSRVRTLVDTPHPARRHSVVWDGTDDAGRPVASGTYWARLTTSTGFTAETKMTIVK